MSTACRWTQYKRNGATLTTILGALDQIRMTTFLRTRVEEQITAAMTPNGIVIGLAILIAAIEVTLTGGPIADEGVLLRALRSATDICGQWMREAWHEWLGHTFARGGIIVARLAGGVRQFAFLALIVPIAAEHIVECDAILDDAAVIELVCLALGRRFVDATLLGLIEVQSIGTLAVLVGLLSGTVIVAVARFGITYPGASGIHTRHITLAIVGAGESCNTLLRVLVEEGSLAGAGGEVALRIDAGDITTARLGIPDNGVVNEQAANIIDACLTRVTAREENQHAQQAQGNFLSCKFVQILSNTSSRDFYPSTSYTFHYSVRSVQLTKQ